MEQIIDVTFISGLFALLLIFAFVLWRIRYAQRVPKIDTTGPASRRYSPEKWDVVGYFEAKNSNRVDKALIRKAVRAKADVIAYERSGLWVYLKRTHS